MIPKPLADIAGPDLQELVTAARRESRTIDYKSSLPGNSDEDKRNLLYDVTAFANTLGGDIVYGVEEELSPDGKKTGVASAIVGVETSSRERDEQRLESVIRSGVDPRVPGVALRWVDSPSSERPTLVLRVPRSVLGPHMVVFGGMTRFYGRGTSGNFPMDVREIRSAFELSGDVARRLREFRANRLIQMQSGEPDVSMEGSSRMVLHVVPLSAFELGAQVDLTNPPYLHLLTNEISPNERRFNVDGYLLSESIFGYVQLFRTGAIEAVDCHLVSAGPSGTGVLPSTSIEVNLLRSSREYIEALTALGARGPFFLALTLTGIKGYSWAIARHGIRDGFGPPPAFDRDLILLPELRLEMDVQRSWSARLKPLLDGLWQAAGRPRSDSFNEQGEWIRGGGL